MLEIVALSLIIVASVLVIGGLVLQRRRKSRWQWQTIKRQNWHQYQYVIRAHSVEDLIRAGENHRPLLYMGETYQYRLTLERNAGGYWEIGRMERRLRQ